MCHIEVTMTPDHPSPPASNWSASDGITRVSSIEHGEVERADVPLEKTGDGGEHAVAVTFPHIGDRMVASGFGGHVCCLKALMDDTRVSASFL